jgi:hypothetical protein
VGDELDQQVKVVARLAPGAYDRGQHAPLGAELVQPGLERGVGANGRRIF